MVLSKRYRIRVVAGWAIFGGASLLSAMGFIGGAATFFLLVAFASWSVFPLLHFIVAALAARKLGHDPSVVLSGVLVVSVMLLLVGLLASGLFNYV